MALGNIYYFNPTCELAVANGSFSYQPPLLLQEMEHELAILPFIFCSENDFVLAESKPNEIFLQQLKNVGFNLPYFYNLAELEAMPEGSFNQIIPWGWSPSAHYKFSRLKEKCSPEFKKSPVYSWHEVHKTLYERSASLSFLHTILDSNTDENLITKDLTGTIVNSINEIETLLQKHKQLVIKAPLSSSGRGIQMIRKPELDKARKQWIGGVLKQQNYLVAEPLLEKKIDFSFQFRITSEKEVDFLGLSFFETNSNGQYQRTLINPNPELLLKTRNCAHLIEKMYFIAGKIQNELINSAYLQHYRGYLGIDAMIFEYQNKSLIHPCVEINSRMNMGILTKFLERKIYPESSGTFELFYGSPGQFSSFINDKIANQQQLGIHSRILPLTEGLPDTKFGAYASVCGPR